ncbi:PepSY domain-containing protein [Mycolicibacillus parakoreensis]|uniref:PepSY domain-containing protein n=1 Tax=Mycolicibacillus parakoreensis TaxID=1069221 RepID=A0ABY3U3L3_9MYCO|nr:PepSY domain-containing protein [Mycolicibacillus parakoreensis]MCV7314487.1 PepSY domain-containing protein [Mycolicibacillus parakoreensis]ULN53175.1 PepSY domain-containing protein [Mycolicibacillus parakoreensis]
MRFARTTAATAAAGLAAFTVAACSSNEPESPELTETTVTTSVSTAPATPTSTTGEAGTAQAAAVESALSALATAATAVPGGQVFDLETEREGDQLQFEAKVAADGVQHTVLLDETGHTVLSQQPEEEPDDDIAKLEGITVTAEQALQTASDDLPGAQFGELEIDSNADDAVIWEVELLGADGAKTEYNIDAHTGEILSP